MKSKSNHTSAKARKRRSLPSPLKFRRILVPSDFSGFSRQALSVAVPLARAYGAKISMVHVIPPPVLIEPMPGGGPYSGSYLPISSYNQMSEVKAVSAAKTQLDKVAAQFVPDDLRDCKAVRVGNAACEVVLAAMALKSDLVVLSAHGQSRLKHIVIGSTAERIVRHASCPVLTVRCKPGSPAMRMLSGEKPVYPKRLPWRRVLVPLDFSLTSLRALPEAVALARQSGASLLLLNVVEPNPNFTGLESTFLVEPDSAVVVDAEAHLPQIARRFIPKSIRATTLVRRGRAADVIVAAAEKNHVDLIVLSTHGHTGLERLLLGSTAEQVVRHAKCPVLVVRQPRGSSAHE